MNYQKATARISSCGRYRYVLSRSWGPPGNRSLWIMLNPSTADASTDDPTIRRIAGFCRMWGLDGFRIVNLFALRSPNPADLLIAEDPVGPDNDKIIAAVARVYRKANMPIVAAWGTGSRAAKLVAERAEIVSRIVGAPLDCLGVTKSGQPKHPLYISATTKLVRWRS